MNEYTVVTSNVTEFSDVLKFYGKEAKQYGESKYGICRLYINNSQFTGWDSYKNNSRQHNKEVSFLEWTQLINPKPTTKVASNMKYVVEVNSHEEANAVRKFKGNLYSNNIRQFPWCVNGVTGDMSGPEFYAHHVSDYGPIISFKLFSEMFGIELKPNKTLKLTNEYTAEVNYNTKVVQVGCQSIPFNKVEELAKLIKK